MRIGLIGAGKMGLEIERQATPRGHQVIRRFWLEEPLGSDADLSGIDVLIDFSAAEAVLKTLTVAAQAGIPVVEGTTGWYGRLEEAKAIDGLTMLYSPNFSVGVYHFQELVKLAARLYGRVGTYDTYIHEWHHAGKADSPSGTARKLSELVLAELPEKQIPLYDTSHRTIEPRELHVTSTRVGRVPGTHLVGFDSAVDSIELKHTAHGREGFALGAVLGAEWLIGREGVFSMDDFMSLDPE